MNSSETYEELIRRIIADHHEYAVRAFAEIGGLLAIAQAEDKSSVVLYLTGRVFAALRKEVEPHLLREEKDYFPAIMEWEAHPTADKQRKLVWMMEALEREHRVADRLLAQLRDITKNFAVPAGAAESFRAIMQRLREFAENMKMHVHLEDDVLFPRLQEQLSDTAG